MEGSPIRGRDKAPIVQLNESQDLHTFQDDLVRLIRADLKHAQILFGFRDIDANSWSLPSWVRSFLERHVALQKKLEQGETVAIGYGKDDPALVPADAARSSIILIPLRADGKLRGAIGVVSPLSGPQPSTEALERVRRLAYEAGPILLRLQEVEKLRRENQHLAAAAKDAAQMEKRLGRLLEENTALDAVNQIWSHLQVNVAHELRTPLAAIRGYARMILDGRGGEVSDTQRAYLQSVCDNTNRLINTVSWMSYVAELSARHFKLSTFDLREVWAECAAASHELLHDKAVKLTQQISQEDFSITGDREKLAYAISELLATAVKFSAAGGTIAAEFSHGREREVIVRISAQGSPIPAATLDRIFDRAFNTSAPTAGQNVEAGAINLSGAYDFVGMHGGRVFVVSTAGQGATLMFTLPAVKSGGGVEKTHEQAINSGSRRR